MGKIVPFCRRDALMLLGLRHSLCRPQFRQPCSQLAAKRYYAIRPPKFSVHVSVGGKGGPKRWPEPGRNPAKGFFSTATWPMKVGAGGIVLGGVYYLSWCVVI
jgi:hypothetical protein